MTGSSRLNALDTAWLFTESRATPNHVGGLLQFRLPERARKDFMRRLMAGFRSHRKFRPPWNRRLKVPFNKNPLPAWVEDDDIDLEYHVRHAALPWPGGERELGELVGRLQSQPLDLSRPPWECTIIEGLEGNRFALFIKMHHSLIDGVSGMKLLQRAMSADRARSLRMPPFWASGARRPPEARRADADVRRRRRRRRRGPEGPGPVPAAARHGLRADPEARGRSRRGHGGAFRLAPVDAQRPRARNAAIRHAAVRPGAPAGSAAAAGTARSTTWCWRSARGALRRFLLERDALPEKSLTAGIPVSVRPKDDEGHGNAISFIVATLATDVADPAERFRAIRDSVSHAKAHVQGLPRAAMMQYTVLLMAPTIVTLLTGIGGRTRPMFNVTISNVPGPEKPLYFRGAELVAIYPASIVTHGQALNITCQSYAGSMDFGFTGCHSSVPSLQKLAVYAADALEELERPSSPSPSPKPPAARRGPLRARKAMR